MVENCKNNFVVITKMGVNHLLQVHVRIDGASFRYGVHVRADRHGFMSEHTDMESIL